MTSLRLGAALAYLIVVIAAWPASAQTNTGEIAGVVRDSVGGVLPGVAITARHPDTGLAVERITDDGGRFFLPALRVGTWEIRAEVAGFAPRTESVVLEIGRTLAIDLTLGVASLTEQVRVSGTVPLLQVTTAEISDVINNSEVVGIPLNGRNFLALAQLSDAVVLPPAVRAARRCSRPGRCRTSAVSAPDTTSTCWTASR